MKTNFTSIEARPRVKNSVLAHIKAIYLSFSLVGICYFICSFIPLSYQPLICGRFYWLFYATWRKLTGRLSRNNPRLQAASASTGAEIT